MIKLKAISIVDKASRVLALIPSKTQLHSFYPACSSALILLILDVQVGKHRKPFPIHLPDSLVLFFRGYPLLAIYRPASALKARLGTLA